MSGGVPGPGLHGDGDPYERPSQPWVCGNAAHGARCRVGPDSKGRCRAEFECHPWFEVREGETKGRYHCTRPKEWGGPCADGPAPDGVCGRKIARCVPARSLRSRRGRLVLALCTATVALLAVFLGGSSRLKWIHPGPVSPSHRSPAFLAAQGKAGGEERECAGCHRVAHASLGGWFAETLSINPRGSFSNVHGGVSFPAIPSKESMDPSCRRCHKAHDDHHADVSGPMHCTGCHVEHRGADRLARTRDSDCAACHDDASVMGTAPRFASFHAGHPEFQVVARGIRETHALRFNHQRHFAEDVPKLNGKKLDCAACHQPDGSGLFHAPVSFELHCQSCHDLQFDERNPGLKVPHGNASGVRAFFASLPVQYAAHARSALGMTSQRDLETYVAAQMESMRAEHRSTQSLEQKIFLSDKRRAPVEQVGALPAMGKSLFYGCVFCHEVRTGLVGSLEVVEPAAPTRRLNAGSFDHARHRQVDCRRCHDAENSRESADLILPSQSVCSSCHSPQGGAAHDCSLCHTFHRKR